MKLNVLHKMLRLLNWHFRRSTASFVMLNGAWWVDLLLPNCIYRFNNN